MTVSFITTPAELDALCQILAKSNWLAIDTEFLREKTYFPQLCLIQVATDEVIACVDPLALDDLSPLLDLIYHPDTTVVFHAARQDLELLFQLRQSLPKHVFDTQLAATVLGYGEQVGYGNLVKQCLNVELEKAHSRADWTVRPLSAEQIKYAADDVRYLRDLYHQMKQCLSEQNRLHWLSEDFAQLSQVETYQPATEKIWQKIKGAGRLKPQQLVVLQYLAAWREQVAIARNRPRRWILKDEVVLDIARFAPTTGQKLTQIRGFEDKDMHRYGEALIEQIQLAKQVDKQDWPTLTRPQPLSSQQDAIADCLNALLRKYCDEQSITPSAVATRKDIESLLRGDKQATLLHGWRYEIVGHQLEAFLNGQSSIKADRNTLLVTEK